MYKLTVYKIKDKLCIEYKPTKEETEIPKDLILDYGKLYKPINLEDIPKILDSIDFPW
ncbi:MAG: hypothetical protein IKB64_09790 [Paludibacteraceae bacterium]|nr:hypothetical protein [Paludibacteraceae bacterium]